MNRIASLTAALVAAVVAVLVGVFLTASPAGEAPTATASPAVTVNGLDADGRYVGDGADDDSLAGDGPAVPVAPVGGAAVPAGGAVTASDGGGAVPAPVPAVPASDGGGEGAVPSGDGFDPAADALPADAPRVCVILAMGAAACESFVHPAPGEVSVAVIYSDDDEHAIVETIAYDEHGPIDYVDFWEGETTPSE